MKTDWTQERLVAFEEDIAQRFLRREILSPVHLAGGNERQLIDIFAQHVNPADWVCCQWRSHYHCLLKGVPEDEVRAAILAGKSISLCFKEQRIISSAIAGGIAPIAVGIAMGIVRRDRNHCIKTGYYGDWPSSGQKVVCFLGDMTARMGIVRESIEYAANFDLPLLWVIEDNGVSVNTPTVKAWGVSKSWLGSDESLANIGVIRYRYKMTRPHVGVGKWVSF